MSKLKNIVIGTTIGAGVIGLFSYLWGLKRTSAELESVATGMIHSLAFDGLTVRIDVQLKNPTGSSLNIKYPFVKLYHAGKLIGSSKVIDKNIKIPSHGEATIGQIMLTIPATGLLALGSGLLNLLNKKQAVPLAVKTVSTIDLGWKKIAYQKTEEITLKPKQA